MTIWQFIRDENGRNIKEPKKLPDQKAQRGHAYEIRYAGSNVKARVEGNTVAIWIKDSNGRLGSVELPKLPVLEKTELRPTLEDLRQSDVESITFELQEGETALRIDTDTRTLSIERHAANPESR